ncbi:MAG: hypothetical protein KatS3mg031_2159 [Chitinophagales bacterium]|nr:MAG: hypothetical protein KatS3mg031_2159 [Chitinophagales bacterium]
MKKFTETEIERIANLLREGKPLPEDYLSSVLAQAGKTILFDTRKEYELVYAGKERE